MLTRAQKDHLIKDLEFVQRTAKAWISTLKQDLDQLYDIEQNSILRHSRDNFIGAIELLGNSILASDYDQQTSNHREGE